MNRFSEAYTNGVNGKELRAEAGRFERFLHRRGSKRMAEIAGINDAIMKERFAVFEDASENASGLNKTVMDVLRSANSIPHPADSFEPLSGVDWIDEKGKKTHQWIGAFSFGSDPDDPARAFRTPLANHTRPLHLDDLKWAHYGFRTPVKSIGITVNLPMNDFGDRGYPSSEIEFNTRDYNPDNLASLMDRGDDHFDGFVRVTIDDTGAVSKIERSSTFHTGLEEQDLSTTSFNTEALLHDLQHAVDTTVLAYRTDELDPPRS